MNLAPAILSDPRVRAALALMKRLHAGATTVDGREYAAHPIAVAELLYPPYCNDPDSVITALLHDTIEDCYGAMGAELGRFKALEESEAQHHAKLAFEAGRDYLLRFGFMTPSIVCSIMRVSRIGGYVWNLQRSEPVPATYAEFIRNLGSSDDDRAIAVKIADLRHNSDFSRLRGLHEDTRRRIEGMIVTRYRNALRRLGASPLHVPPSTPPIPAADDADEAKWTAPVREPAPPPEHTDYAAVAEAQAAEQLKVRQGNRLYSATALATQLHEGQKAIGGIDYVAYLNAVTSLLPEKSATTNTKVVALLHDIGTESSVRIFQEVYKVEPPRVREPRVRAAIMIKTIYDFLSQQVFLNVMQTLSILRLTRIGDYVWNGDTSLLLKNINVTTIGSDTFTWDQISDNLVRAVSFTQFVDHIAQSNDRPAIAVLIAKLLYEVDPARLEGLSDPTRRVRENLITQRFLPALRTLGHADEPAPEPSAAVEDTPAPGSFTSSFNTPGYHMWDIPKGVLGEASKIAEEAAEFADAVAQGASLMALHELSDLYGAMNAYLAKHHPSLGMQDVEKMSRLTERAFRSGKRQ